MRPIILGQFAAQGPIGGGGFQSFARLADDDGSPAFLAHLRIDARLAEHVEQVLQGVVVEVVAFEIDAWQQRTILGGQFVVVRAPQRLEQGTGPEIRPADAEDHHPVDILPQPVRLLQDLAQNAGLGLFAKLIQRESRQIDESGIERRSSRPRAAAVRARRQSDCEPA